MTTRLPWPPKRTARRLLTPVMGLTASIALCSFLLFTPSYAQQPASDVAIDNDDIGGVVTGPNGPEAGVWVIAETRDLPVRYIKSVVTDDRGRFVVPDLPTANYQVWARGYGLVDSAKATAKPGQRLGITAVVAPNEAAAAHYYPAIYWYSMLKIPAADQFGGKSSIPARLTQTNWISSMKNTGCIGCHQLGQESTRTIPACARHVRVVGAEAWRRRVQSGQSGQQMLGQLTNLGDTSVRQLRRLDRSHRQGRAAVRQAAAAAGRRAQHRRHAARLDEREAVPARPDRQRSPLPDRQRLRAALRIARVQLGHAADSRSGEERGDDVHGAGARSQHAAQPRPGPRRGARRAAAVAVLGQRAHLGNARQQPQLDVRPRRAALAGGVGPRRRESGVLQGGLGSSVGQGVPDGARRPPPRGARSEDEEVHVRRHLLLDAPSAVRLRRQRHALDERRRSGRRLAQHEDVRPDRRRREVAGMDGARARHQRQRQARRLHRARSAARPDEGHAHQLAVLRRDAEPGRRFDLGIDARRPRRGRPAGARARIRRRPRWPRSTACRCPASARAAPTSTARAWCGCRSAAATSAASIAASARRPLNGPKATGDHCPEGWSFHQYPGPGFKGIGENSAESSYYSWVDQHNTFGLGNDVPMSTGNLNDGLIAFANGRMVVLRVPYPMGFYAKGFDGRIDDPKAGWKGRGLWAANGDRTPWLIEGGKGTKPLAAHFQLRPDPLAK